MHGIYMHHSNALFSFHLNLIKKRFFLVHLREDAAPVRVPNFILEFGLHNFMPDTLVKPAMTHPRKRMQKKTFKSLH